VLAPGADRGVLRVGAVRRRRVHPRWRPFLLAAAALLLGGVAAAAGWTGLVERTPSPPIVVGGAPPAPTLVPASGGRASTIAPLASAGLGAGEDTASTQVSATGVAAAVRAVPPLRPSASVRAGDLTPAPAPMPPPADAAGLFLHANAARRAGNHALAEDVYRTLLTEYSESLEAHQSRALLGHMLLEDGEPARALRYFDEYLRTGGPLAEDVMSDRAAALARLGRPSEESVAWSELLERYPRSVHADRARTRLRELGAP
jgi:TolA-binding protein